MKKLKSVKGYTIVQLNERDKINHNSTSDYACILNDEMEYPAALRSLDWECDSLQECLGFIG